MQLHKTGNNDNNVRIQFLQTVALNRQSKTYLIHKMNWIGQGYSAISVPSLRNVKIQK